MTTVRVAFVMEQTLGHVTHARNLRAVLDQQARVTPTWLPIQSDVAGAARLVPLMRSNWSVRASWRARRALDHALGQRQHDGLFFHTQVTSLFSVGLMHRYPSVISMDATPINYDSLGATYGHQPAGDGFLDRQKYQMNRRAFHAAEGLVTWSEWAKASLVKDYAVEPAKVRVIAPGAAPEFFEIGDRRSARLGDGPMRILFVGGDFVRKGGPQLLAALPDDCELHVVTRDAVEPRPNVRIYRDIGPNSLELRRLFEAADVFVLPSLGECLGIAVEEAAAAGLPVIVTNVGALGEGVRADETGLIVPSGEVIPVRAALEAMRDDPVRRRRMGRAARLLAGDKFDARQNNGLLLDFVGGIADARQKLRRTA